MGAARKKYTPEYKAEAVDLVVNSGRLQAKPHRSHSGRCHPSPAPSGVARPGVGRVRQMAAKV